MKERLASVGRTSSLHGGLENGWRNVGSPPRHPPLQVCPDAGTLGATRAAQAGARTRGCTHFSPQPQFAHWGHRRVALKGPQSPPFTLWSLGFPPWKSGTENTDPPWVSATDPHVQGEGLWEGPAEPRRGRGAADSGAEGGKGSRGTAREGAKTRFWNLSGFL